MMNSDIRYGYTEQTSEPFRIFYLKYSVNILASSPINKQTNKLSHTFQILTGTNENPSIRFYNTIVHYFWEVKQKGSILWYKCTRYSNDFTKLHISCQLCSFEMRNLHFLHCTTSVHYHSIEWNSTPKITPTHMKSVKIKVRANESTLREYLHVFYNMKKLPIVRLN